MHTSDYYRCEADSEVIGHEGGDDVDVDYCRYAHAAHVDYRRYTSDIWCFIRPWDVHNSLVRRTEKAIASRRHHQVQNEDELVRKDTARFGQQHDAT